MQKSLITGGRGQDAQLLGRYLIQKGEKVFFTTRDKELSKSSNFYHLDPKDLNLEIMIIDIINKENINRIYHLASQNTSSEKQNDNIEDLYNSNILFTESILNAALLARNQVKVLVAGTCHQFTPKKKKSINYISKQSKESPRNLYGLTKSVNRLQTLNYRRQGLFASFVILFNHESYLRTTDFLLPKLCKLAALIILYESNPQNPKPELINIRNFNVSVDWSDAEIFVKAFTKILDQDKSDDYVLGSGTATKLGDIVNYIQKNECPNILNYISYEINQTKKQEILCSPKGEESVFKKLKIDNSDIYRLVSKMIKNYKELAMKKSSYGLNSIN